MDAEEIIRRTDRDVVGVPTTPLARDGITIGDDVSID